MLTWNIPPLDYTARVQIQARIDQKTKPPGALGQLENLALQLALVQNQATLTINKPVMLVFAADHGIAGEGVSIAPSDVTRLMVLNFLGGGAAINCFCRDQGWTLKVIDAGINEPVHPTPDTAASVEFLVQRIGAGTRNFAQEPAMTLAQARDAIQAGAALARAEIASGADLLGFGEMGIGNTSSAAALLAAISGADVAVCVGRGTGISDTQLARKQALIATALQRITTKDPVTLLAELGGFEIAQICGAMLATAERRRLILVDGFIVSVAALLACRMAPAARDYMVFCHQSAEQAHRLVLQLLEAKPLLDLGLRLGEGTGAALALPLVRAAASFYNQMASFADLGIAL